MEERINGREGDWRRGVMEEKRDADRTGTK